MVISVEVGLSGKFSVTIGGWLTRVFALGFDNSPSIHSTSGFTALSLLFFVLDALQVTMLILGFRPAFMVDHSLPWATGMSRPQHPGPT